MSSFRNSTAHREPPATPLVVLHVDNQSPQPDYEGHLKHRSQHYSTVSTLDFNHGAHSSTIGITEAKSRMLRDGTYQQGSFTQHDGNFRSPSNLEDVEEVSKKNFSAKMTQNYHRIMRFILRSGKYSSLPPQSPSKLRLGKSYRGWRGGCLLAAISTTIVLLINLTFTVWGAIYAKSGMGIATLLVAECNSVNNASKVLHYAINALGTLLVAASNYSMQCLSSPTRKEIDDAHSRGIYLNIGVFSFRNLIGWKKKVLFTLLVCSTLPLHFFWNSAVFTTTRALNFNILVVTPKFINDSGPFQRKSDNASKLNMYGPYYPDKYYLEGKKENYYLVSLDQYHSDINNKFVNNLRVDVDEGLFTRLENAECINEYGNRNTLGLKYGDLLVVTKNLAKNDSSNTFLAHSNSTIFFGFNNDTQSLASSWLCQPYSPSQPNNEQCDYSKIAESASSWTMAYSNSTEELEVDHCLAKNVETDMRCRLQYSPRIMICVLVSNITKLICISLLLYSRQEPILATVGDGIASFMELAEPAESQSAQKFANLDPTSSYWREPSSRWWDAPSKSRWLTSLSPCILVICIVLALIKSKIAEIQSDTDAPSTFSIGLGEYNNAAKVGFPGASTGSYASSEDFSSSVVLFNTAAVVNLPQVIVSFLYFGINSVLTSMTAADEWSRYSIEPKSLRTTFPEGLQRSTYWLSLPWTYGLPLALASTVLHFLISQSLFVSRYGVYYTNGEIASGFSHVAVACSPLAALLAVILGIVVVLATVIISARKLKPCILAQNNSLVIAAACRRPKDDGDGHLKMVKWGAIRHQVGAIPGHCCFTSKEVESPRICRLYTGIRDINHEAELVGTSESLLAQ